MINQQELVTNLLKEYYKGVKEIAPDKVEQREFGTGTFAAKILFRHIAFSNSEELKKYLAFHAPPYVSYSSAYYRYPDSRPMEKKEWLGGELLFDLDSTDMELACQKTHSKSFVCENCFKSVREETIKLIEDFLIPDFGFSENEMSVNFSGNRGYHVHVKSDEILLLDSNARKEISDYISGNGIKLEEFFPTGGQRGTKLIGPKLSDPGWGGKLARNLLKALDLGPESLVKMGIEKKTANLLHRKKALVELGLKTGNWDMVYIKNKDKFWLSAMQRQAIMQSDKIDKNVTLDTSKLIRLPNSIHGETGLIAKKIKSKSELSNYDPMKECIAFSKGEARVKIEKLQKITIAGIDYGPFNNETVTLPIGAAVYIALKGFGSIHEVV